MGIIIGCIHHRMLNILYDSIAIIIVRFMAVAVWMILWFLDTRLLAMGVQILFWSRIGMRCSVIVLLWMITALGTLLIRNILMVVWLIFIFRRFFSVRFLRFLFLYLLRFLCFFLFLGLRIYAVAIVITIFSAYFSFKDFFLILFMFFACFSWVNAIIIANGCQLWLDYRMIIMEILS